VLVRKFQQIQIRQKTEAEQKITDLQLRIVRNQLDPHFTMNAVNSVIAGITAINSGDAKAQLMHFSALHRSLLLDSDRTRRSLKEEIGFTENYLALEKFRFGERFEYLIDIDPAVDIHAEVPKMMLQVYVENALKHGILPLQKKGLLVIRIKGTDPLSVEIRDNGVGRKAAANRNGDDTGMGMQAMEQSFALFGKLGLGKMTAAIDDLYDDSGNPAGTSVVITIHSNHEKR
jgi:LytS/YehU family sensor histidine kinase